MVQPGIASDGFRRGFASEKSSLKSVGADFAVKITPAELRKGILQV